MSDLWPEIIESNAFEENRALDILEEQVKGISKKTNGKIKGLVTKIAYNDNMPVLISAMSIFAKTISGMEINSKEVLEEELITKEDINNLYKATPYKFEIYNSSFRFRILVLINRIDFPIQITIDEGISEELKIERHKLIETNTQFEETLSQILRSSKMKSVLNRMLNYQEEEIENKILVVIQEQNDIKIVDIAKKLNYSRASIYKTIDKMINKGMIQYSEKNKKKYWEVLIDKQQG